MTDQISMGIVGLRFGQYIVDEQISKDPGREYFKLAGLCDLDASKVESLARRHNVPVYQSLDAMLADDRIKVVGLFTPPAGRAQLIRRTIRAGKHVVTTKPFELDPQAALSVLHEARELGMVVHLNSPSPLCPPEIAQILRWRQEYDLGAAVSGQWDVWVNYHEKADGSWYDDFQKCPVAPILRLGIYGISDLVKLFGPAKSVQVMSSKIRTGRPTADNAQMLLRFHNGVLATLTASFCIDDGKAYAYSKRISFERGTVYCDVGPGGGGANPQRARLELAIRDGNEGRVVDCATCDTELRTGVYQWKALYNAVCGEKLEGETSPEEIAAGIAIIAAMIKADASHQEEPVDVAVTNPAAPSRRAKSAAVR